MKIIFRIFVIVLSMGMAIAAVGCGTLLDALGPRSQVSPDFDPDRVDPIAVVVTDETLYWRSGRDRGGVYRQIEDEFIQHLMAKGYTLVSRSDIQNILMEAEFQRESGLTADDAVRMGHMLNVPAVLIVTVTEAEISSEMRTFLVRDLNGERKERRRVYRGHAGVGARLIDVETGQVLWISTYSLQRSLPGRDQVGHAIRPTAAGIARDFPARYSTP